MIIHLTGSATNIKEDLPYFRRIVKTIKDADGTLAQDWVEDTYQNVEVKKVQQEDVDWQTIMQETLDAISRADVVIIEVTNYTFSQGFQAATALQQKKPVLLVSRAPLNKHLVSGYKSRDSKMAEYKTEQELDKIVTQFIRENTISTKDLRFNMFIDRPIYNYLRSVSYETGKNKSEIIRELINREIRKKD